MKLTGEKKGRNLETLIAFKKLRITIMWPTQVSKHEAVRKQGCRGVTAPVGRDHSLSASSL